jgi:hypothetical protein
MDYSTARETIEFQMPHLNINTGSPSDELDKNVQRK